MKTYSSTFFLKLWLALAVLYWAAATLLHEFISNNIVVPFKNALGAVSTEYAFVALTLCGIGALLWLVRSPRPCAAVNAQGHKGTLDSGVAISCLSAQQLAADGGAKPADRALSSLWPSAYRWLLLIAAAALCSVFLMVTRIEMAHFPQYAILAVLLRLAALSPASVYLAGQCGSIVDEGRQYLLHPRYTGYFDWNDLVINSVGLCIGLLLMRGYSTRSLNEGLSRIVARVSGALLGLTTLGLLAGLLIGYVRVYVPLVAGQTPDPFPVVEGSRVLALFLREPPAFWQAGPFGQFHVMGFTEGILVYPLCSLLLFLCCFYRKKS